MEEDNVNTLEIRGYTDETGKFKEGNPGKPKGAISYSKRLDEALNKIETTGNKDLFEKFINRAFVDDKVLIAAMKKFVPDMEKSEISGADGEPIVINLIPVSSKQDVDKLENNDG